MLSELDDIIQRPFHTLATARDLPRLVRNCRLVVDGTAVPGESVRDLVGAVHVACGAASSPPEGEEKDGDFIRAHVAKLDPRHHKREVFIFKTLNQNVSPRLVAAMPTVSFFLRPFSFSFFLLSRRLLHRPFCVSNMLWPMRITAPRMENGASIFLSTQNPSRRPEWCTRVPRVALRLNTSGVSRSNWMAHTSSSWDPSATDPMRFATFLPKPSNEPIAERTCSSCLPLESTCRTATLDGRSTMTLDLLVYSLLSKLVVTYDSPWSRMPTMAFPSPVLASAMTRGSR